MYAAPLIRRVALTRAAPVAFAAVVAVPAALIGEMALAVAAAVLAIGAALWIDWLQRRVAGDKAPQSGTEPPPVQRQRVVEVHPVSGLPVREGLIERIARDRGGLLGIIAFTDFDRLSAFDPVLADRVFTACTKRLRAMLPAERFLAQVDRGHIGVWFGAGPGDAPSDATSDADAWAELDAVAYALSEVIVDGDNQIIPQVAFRLAPHDAADGQSPAAFVARTLASFALPPCGSVSVVQPVADQAETARDRFALEQDLRQAIDRRELRLAYQPLVDASQGCIGGAEALIRWEHPTRGLIPPAQFVPVLESMGLAQEIGMWALNTALREARGWAASDLGRLRVAVNVSSLQLERDDLPQLVQRTLESHGVSASQLELELTESVATSDAEHCRGIFARLRAMGIKLAVDDFGTGYSGFSSLRTLDFDKIKIDREFVTDVDSRGDSQAICQSIIALGRGLGIRVLAEGVERRGEYEWLRRHGCHHFQGYYFGQPMTGEAFAAWVRDREALGRLLAPPGGGQRILEKIRA
ncbi:EAL domain-containing protein [Sphingomonas donggukensis]|uniref:EAL domain-containing protein n=1 Tax=Sphingomonas donggukensis TaxID=2949093 RepID=A0ABY4TTF2_9SPHN|nr:EAL domain-containing protein [Sphingomonas donggukensis]URW75115.1 EAL domain-containing protein [Sphingomonas donggukensis]